MIAAGAYTALVSPFLSGKLDEARLKDQIEAQISGGITGIVPVGTTGESPTLGFDEHERAIELAVKYSGGRVKVMAGVGGNATLEAEHLHRYAAGVGADYALSVNPYYNKPSQEGLYAHFCHLSEKVPELPIVLYNIPGRTGITMSAATVARLRKNANVIAIKEACGSLDMVSEIMAASDIPVLSGDDSLTVPMIALGGIGVVSVASNLLPGEISEMTRLALAGQFPAAAAIHHKLFPLIKSLFADGNPVGIKHAMKLAGRDSGELRLPLVAANASTQMLIADQMKALGLIG